MVEQISVIETAREIKSELLKNYLPAERDNSPALISDSKDSINERELMYKFLFDMKKDLTELKKLVVELIPKDGTINLSSDQANTVNRLYSEVDNDVSNAKILPPAEVEENFNYSAPADDNFEKHVEVEESLSLEDREKELIEKALTKHKGKRKYAAAELGISERTLYRKIKEYNLTH